MNGLGHATDGRVQIRPPRPGDRKLLIDGRDTEFHRFLGDGSPDPQPAFCIAVDDRVVGWVDVDHNCDWLEPGEVNLGYNVFPSFRQLGYASRAVKLALHRLALAADCDAATLLIDPANTASLELAERTGFAPAGEVQGQRYFKQPIPPLTYTDGIVTIRRMQVDDIDRDLEAKDDEQIRWLWLPGQGEKWRGMTSDERRAHAIQGLADRNASFGQGPKWEFAVDTADQGYVAYVDCDLDNDQVPAGRANISYSCHPADRGRGYVSRAVRLVLQFLAEHTGAPDAHILVHRDNAPSLRVAAAVGGVPADLVVDDFGRTLLRHTVTVPVGASDRDPA